MRLWPAGFIWLHYGRLKVRLKPYGRRVWQGKAAHLIVARKQTDRQAKAGSSVRYNLQRHAPESNLP